MKSKEIDLIENELITKLGQSNRLIFYFWKYQKFTCWLEQIWNFVVVVAVVVVVIVLRDD